MSAKTWRGTTCTRALLDDLKLYTQRRDLKGGRQAHAQAVESRCHSKPSIATALVNMYAKCGSIEEAKQVFEQMECHTVVAWTTLMQGHVQTRQPKRALELFTRMQRQGCIPDERTYAVALKACAAMAVEDKDILETGWGIYTEALCRGYDRDVFLSNTLMDMFARCGSMVEARRVFDKLKHRNAVSWTILISGYADQGENELALEMFARMQTEQQHHSSPDVLVYVAAIKACTGLAVRGRGRGESVQEFLKTGKEIHTLASSTTNQGLDIVFHNTLVDMFSKSGSMEDANRIFTCMPHHSLVTYTALMLGYVQSGEANNALDLFETMSRRVCELDAPAIVAALKACTSLAWREKGEEVKGKLVKLSCLDKGMKIHSQAKKTLISTLQHLDRVENSLMDMYAQCQSLLDARMVFDRMISPGVVSWNALLLAYTECREPTMALQLFSCMPANNVAYDSVTLIAALKACSSTADLESTKSVHSLVLRSRTSDWKSQEEVDNTLVDAYAKCGNMVDSQMVFDSKCTTNTFNWSALVGGYSRSGDTQLVFQLFASMRAHGLKPDGVLFLSLLTSCSHAGQVSRGECLFQEMKDRYGITPEFEHYRCMIDMLGRANRLEAALEMARCMPFKPNLVTWRTILAACSKWKNFSVARRAFEELVEIDERDDAAYHLMESICASLGLWDEHSKVQARRSRLNSTCYSY